MNLFYDVMSNQTNIKANEETGTSRRKLGPADGMVKIGLPIPHPQGVFDIAKNDRHHFIMSCFKAL